MASFCAAHSHSHHPAGLEATRGSLAPSQGARLSGNGERRRGNGLRLPLTMREEGERPALDTSAATTGPNDGDQERTLDANLSYCRRFWYDNGLEDEDRIDCAGGEHGVRAAVANGADAVYFGLEKFNARMRADNFTEEELPGLVRFLHEHGLRAFCTVNTLIFTDELAAAERELMLLDEAGVDVIIVQDLGLAVLARELGVKMDVHASTQMTITSPEGAKFAGRLGVKRVVLAREASMRAIAKFGGGAEIPALEVFVHGALCVAYSGQCLTSEALGQRSANRGECAQACRLPYELVVDGALKDLGDRRYLLSPQDLAAVQEIPELIRLGVTGFKIEGRLKTPEYVAATCQVYRKAIDAANKPANKGMVDKPADENGADKYKLEMAFSRGLYSGWLHGVNHQELVHARFGKKRGPFAGFIKTVGADHVEVDSPITLIAGDGVVNRPPHG